MMASVAPPRLLIQTTFLFSSPKSSKVSHLRMEGFMSTAPLVLAVTPRPCCGLLTAPYGPLTVTQRHWSEAKQSPMPTLGVSTCFMAASEALQNYSQKTESPLLTALRSILVSVPCRSTTAVSFLRDGPLDMRMEKSGMSAADAVNSLPESELADIIYKYGEERFSRRVAHAIVNARKERPFSRTIHLADAIRAEVRRSQDGIDPATRTFQALRIYVNDELGELERGLAGAERILGENGRLAVVSFHSLEDRIVKTFIRDRSGRGPNPSRHQPAPNKGRVTATFSTVNSRAITPSKREIGDNPRSRSARLRIAERTAVPVLSTIDGGVA